MRIRPTAPGWMFALALWASIMTGCSLKQKAVSTVADVLGEADKVYLSDEDPELIADALPFQLKLIETLLVSSPDHRPLLLTATKSFVFYAYGFVDPEAASLEVTSYSDAQQVRVRAAKLYRRAYRYGLHGLEVEHHGISELLPREPEQAAARLRAEDIGLAVWTAAALGSAISNSKDDAESTADIEVVGALLNRALELDESFENGAIHEFLITYETQFAGGSYDRARTHYERALQLGRGKSCGTWLSWAENVSLAQQNRAEFDELIGRVLSFDIESAPENRLLNILAQRRARLLQSQVDDLFLPTDISDSEPSAENWTDWLIGSWRDLL